MLAKYFSGVSERDSLINGAPAAAFSVACLRLAQEVEIKR